MPFADQRDMGRVAAVTRSAAPAAAVGLLGWPLAALPAAQLGMKIVGAAVYPAAAAAFLR